jgi:hypothetical protein
MPFQKGIVGNKSNTLTEHRMLPDWPKFANAIPIFREAMQLQFSEAKSIHKNQKN